MKSYHQDFIAGVRDTLPILLGVVPFGMICGVGAVSVGLTPFEAIGMMFIVFAGASQLVVYQLISIGTPWLIMVLTSLVINVRFTMYSAALAPHLQKESLSRKALLAFLITDQAFGVAMSRFVNGLPPNPAQYYYGSAVTIWVIWNICVIAGALIGTLVPQSWGIDFAFPLSFMALMFTTLRDRPTALAALVGGVIAVMAKGLPYNLGLVVAALLGITSGVVAEFLRRPAGEEAT
jgi:predicted branched-subunit amino acid permease